MRSSFDLLKNICRRQVRDPTRDREDETSIDMRSFHSPRAPARERASSLSTVSIEIKNFINYLRARFFFCQRHPFGTSWSKVCVTEFRFNDCELSLVGSFESEKYSPRIARIFSLSTSLTNYFSVFVALNDLFTSFVLFVFKIAQHRAVGAQLFLQVGRFPHQFILSLIILTTMSAILSAP
jgi:hypothetical protein